MILTSSGFVDSSGSSGDLLDLRSIDPRLVPSDWSRKKWNRVLTPRPCVDIQRPKGGIRLAAEVLTGHRIFVPLQKSSRPHSQLGARPRYTLHSATVRIRVQCHSTVPVPTTASLLAVMPSTLEVMASCRRSSYYESMGGSYLPELQFLLSDASGVITFSLASVMMACSLSIPVTSAPMPMSRATFSRACMRVSFMWVFTLSL